MQVHCKHSSMIITTVLPPVQGPTKGAAGLMQGHCQMHQPHPSRSVNLCRQVPQVIDLLSPCLLGTHQAKTNDASWSRPELHPLLSVCAGTKSVGRICPQWHPKQLRASSMNETLKSCLGCSCFYKGDVYKQKERTEMELMHESLAFSMGPSTC